MTSRAAPDASYLPTLRPLGMFIAGNDGAKARVSSFIDSLALRPLDTGDLKMAHRLEGACSTRTRCAGIRAREPSWPATSGHEPGK